MQEKELRQLMGALCNALSKLNISAIPGRKAAVTLLQSDGVQTALEHLLPLQQRICCGDVATFCLPLLDRFAPQPEEGWLKAAYRYVQHLMFPGHTCFAPSNRGHVDACRVYLTVLQVLLDYERQILPFDPFMDFAFLTPEEAEGFDCKKEYVLFLKHFRQEYIYEMLRIGNEATPFHALAHNAGVHHAALSVAKNLYQTGNMVDLPLVSAAAASHDLGKSGCRPGERVPYLHYYYTDQWLTRRKMPIISHIASNHSTWDLELDSLSIESLCLIYADFRSKEGVDENGEYNNIFYSLADSFSVILDKLDGVDAIKRRRYELVYIKLRNFEDYMRCCGVDLDLHGKLQPIAPQKSTALMNPDESIRALTTLSVEHNLLIMHHLSNEEKFGNIIESARSTKDWRLLRAYLDIFNEYFSYLSVSQKTQAITFLHELLVHREGDIRRQAAGLIGKIIALFHMAYRKEFPVDAANDPALELPFQLWEQSLRQIIYPDHKSTAQQRSHIGYTLKLVVDAVLTNARREDVPRFVGMLLSHYHTPERLDSDTAYTLLDAICSLPPQYYDEAMQGKLIDFSGYFVVSKNIRLQTVALCFLRESARSLPRQHPYMRRISSLAGAIPDESITLTFLRYKLLKRAGEDTTALHAALYGQDITSAVFLDNLKTAVPWIVKVVGIDLLRDQIESGKRDQILHIATHFSNLIKVSEQVVVRHAAGAALVRILPLLRREQRNEIIVELGKGLELGQYEISKYIPQYLGEAALYLHPSELDEQVHRLKTLLGAPSDSAVSSALSTIGVILQHYPAYYDRFPQPSASFDQRRETLLGLLLQGLAHYRDPVRQEALLVIGNLLFESNVLSIEEKARLFSLCYRKLLFLIKEDPAQNQLTVYFRSSALAHINRFVSLWRLEHGPFAFTHPKKIAFFPGTFDPFTLSHKGIVRSILALGFEVYLAIDEFSWSKKSQPHLIRRQIVNLSIAGEFHVHLFPDDIPVNIANPNDLERLCALFPQQELYLVVGSDVIAGASAYQLPPQAFSIHKMNHIIFHRAGDTTAETAPPITGDIIRLQLPPHLEDISSTRIRDNVDLNRDISHFVDPVIQDYIYQNGLYSRDVDQKQLLESSRSEFLWLDPSDDAAMRRLTDAFAPSEGLLNALSARLDRLLLLIDTTSQRPLGYIAFHEFDQNDLFVNLRDTELANRVRLRAAGRILLISELYAQQTNPHEDYAQLLLSEALAESLKNGCVYALFFPHNGQVTPDHDELLALQGFIRHEGTAPLLEVDMRKPSVLIQNLETTIQEPLHNNPHIRSVIMKNHRKLQASLVALYPGNLLLTLSADVIHHRLLQMITQYNGVPSTPVTPRLLGECMCVPFGKMLRGKRVPNTVTKTLHTDKVFSPDLSQHGIDAFPHYAPIAHQIRVIKSFQRPVILVDDLMHPGNRIRTIDPLLHQEEVDLRMVLVGVLSGRGRDLMNARNRPVDSVYFLPVLREWHLESTLYPFIGGNTVQRDASPVPGMLPGINHIFPYAAPQLQDEPATGSAIAFSRCCLEASRELIATLEFEYRELYARNLTLSRLCEAVVLPLCPDKGSCLAYDSNLPATVYLDNDLEQLRRSYPQF